MNKRVIVDSFDDLLLEENCQHFNQQQNRSVRYLYAVVNRESFHDGFSASWNNSELSSLNEAPQWVQEQAANGAVIVQIRVTSPKVKIFDCKDNKSVSSPEPYESGLRRLKFVYGL